MLLTVISLQLYGLPKIVKSEAWKVQKKMSSFSYLNYSHRLFPMLVGLVPLWSQLPVRRAQGHHYSFFLRPASLRFSAKPLHLAPTASKGSQIQPCLHQHIGEGLQDSWCPQECMKPSHSHFSQIAWSMKTEKLESPEHSKGRGAWNVQRQKLLSALQLILPQWLPAPSISCVILSPSTSALLPLDQPQS